MCSKEYIETDEYCELEENCDFYLFNEEVLKQKRVADLCAALICKAMKTNSNELYFSYSELQNMDTLANITSAYKSLKELEIEIDYNCECYCSDYKECFIDFKVAKDNSGIIFETSLNNRIYRYYHNEQTQKWNETKVADVLNDLIKEF